jgi:hypothetical protein
MKKQFAVPLLFVLLAVLFVSCMKNNSCGSYTEAQDRYIIDSFLNAKGQDFEITFKTTDGGYPYYSGILNPGNGDLLTGVNSYITFDVVWKLLNGTVIDSTRYPTSEAKIRYGDLNSSASDYYNTYIYAAFAVLQEGGIFRIINLSRTMYGCLGTQLKNGMIVPANAQIITDYKLVDVEN